MNELPKISVDDLIERKRWGDFNAIRMLELDRV